ncbi:MAG: alpha-beta hydrolase superfamily lysophospholipase [Akkermansiaceae bacterium]|jgi:alpha-beta hydrolase superfamily lysophospholipase
MKIEDHRVSIGGQSLHRLILQPEDHKKGTLLFFHGQGDFIDRYPAILEGFVDAGYRCLLTDLPGHGRSPGRRGVVPGFDFIDELFRESITHLEGPAIIAGHSMGGLLALRHFLGHPDLFEAAWFCAPLLAPMRQAKPWMRVALPMVAKILPWLTVGTGVSSSDCGDNTSGRGAETGAVLYHSRISIGWARALAEAAEEVREQFPGLSDSKPILFTQGKRDPICPPEILAEHLAKLTSHRIRFAQVEKALHEPFSGSTLQEFSALLNTWIADELGSR